MNPRHVLIAAALAFLAGGVMQVNLLEGLWD